MKQIWPNYSYSPATNVLTLTGLNIDRDQLLLVTAADRGRIMYNFADSSVTASAFTSGVNTALTLVATTAGLTTTAALVIYYDDQLASTTVTVSSLPAISGTVTANVFGQSVNGTANFPIPIIGYDEDITGAISQIVVPVQINNANGLIGSGNPLSISGTVTIGSALPAGTNRIGVVTIGGGTVTISAGTAQIGSVTASISGTVPISISSVTVGNSVTIGSLPAISGTVTAVLSGTSYVEIAGGIQNYVFDYTSFPISGTVTANPTGTQTIAGSVTASISNSITISANPMGPLTTRFGSVTTANTSQLTAAVTNTAREYLFIQNISVGSVTVGVGFSPTTTQGIQLSPGSGITFDSFCPTGAVWWLGATTGAAWTILEG